MPRDYQRPYADLDGVSAVSEAAARVLDPAVVGAVLGLGTVDADTATAAVLEHGVTLAQTPAVCDLLTPDVVGFNKYYGWYYGGLADLGPWADGAHAAFPKGNIGVSEYGAGASVKIHSAAPKVNDHSEEYQALFHEASWKALAARPYLWGKFVWVMFDFASDGRAFPLQRDASTGRRGTCQASLAPARARE